MINNILMTLNYEYEGIDKVKKFSFKRADSAIYKAIVWINKDGITAKSVTIINKETKEVLWTWEK